MRLAKKESEWKKPGHQTEGNRAVQGWWMTGNYTQKKRALH
jgi:hypothetical protein